MNKEFVPYDMALAMKELGFDEPCIAWWFKESLLMLNQYDNTFPNPQIEAENNNIDIQRKDFNSDEEFNDYVNSCSSPLYQQAFRWFREEYGIVHTIYKVKDDYVFGLDVIGSFHNNSTYQEAQDACLRKLIEIVKVKQ